MKKIGLLFMSFAGVFSAVTTLSAADRESPRERGVEFIFFSPGPVRESISILDVMRKTDNLHFQDAKPPRFLLVDQQHKFALGIGGMARVVNGVEFGGIVNTSTDEGFQPALIGMPAYDFTRSQYRLSAGTSQIFLKMVGRTRNIGDVEVYISSNFQGRNYTPQLRQAYVSFLGLTVGQTWSTLVDLACCPPTIDYAGPNGLSYVLNPMIRYSRKFARERMQFALALEFPQLNGTYGSHAAYLPQSVPDVIGYLQFNWNDAKSHIRASGILRNMAYRNLNKGQSEMMQGWGAQLTSVIALGGRLSMFGQFIYGKGIGSYLNDIGELNRDLVPNPEKTGYLQALPMWGVTGGLQYTFSKRVFVSASYSQSRLYSDRGYDPAGMYKYGQYIVANAFWNLTSDCQLGIEYLRGMKTVHGGEKGHANRMNLMVQYSF